MPAGNRSKGPDSLVQERNERILTRVTVFTFLAQEELTAVVDPQNQRKTVTLRTAANSLPDDVTFDLNRLHHCLLMLALTT